MAREIYQSFDPLLTLYALVYRRSDGHVWNTDSEDFEPYADADLGDYAIALTAVGAMHFADMPDVLEGVYLIQIRLQVGAAPDLADPPISQAYMDWDGKKERTYPNLYPEFTIVKNRIEDLKNDLVSAQFTVLSSGPAEPESKRRILY